MNSPLRSLAFCLASSIGVALAHGAVIYHTDFSAADGYSPGAFGGPNWTTSGTTQWIAQAGGTSPSAPNSITSGLHPVSPSGGSNLLWLSPRTTNVSDNQFTTLTFASSAAPLKEPFTLTFDIFASPTGGSGQSLTIHLARESSYTTTTVPQFSFSSINPETFGLNVRSNSTWNTGVVTLPKASWLRFEIAVNASTNASGTYTTTVYQLDGNGSVTSSLYTQTWDYTLANGFETMRILTNSSRTDYWVDKVTVTTSSIPEPHTASLLAGGLTMLASLSRRRR